MFNDQEVEKEECPECGKLVRELDEDSGVCGKCLKEYEE